MATNFIQAEPGEHIYHTANRAIDHCKKHDLNYTILSHNGIRVSVSKNSDVEDILVIYDLKQRLARLGVLNDV